MSALLDRLFNMSIPEPNSGCWLWLGFVDIRRGIYRYGRVKVNGVKRPAHVVAWEEANNRKMPCGCFGLHSCDVMSCINPDHVFPGTKAENSADMVRKGRQSRRFGEKNTQAVLTEIEVLSIREDNRKYQDIADGFGISISAVSMIKNRERWDWL